MSGIIQGPFYHKKTFEFRMNIRKNELEAKFSTIRNEIMSQSQNSKDKASFARPPKELTQQLVWQEAQKLYANSPEYMEALNFLWNLCMHQEKIKKFSNRCVSKLCLEVMRLKRSRIQPEDFGNEIMMLVWIIGNWCYEFSLCCKLPAQVGQMIEDLIELLSGNINTKMNHLIIYLFTNTCCSQMVRVRLLKGNAIAAVASCSTFQNKQTDISSFVCNFIYNMPYTYRISEACKDHIIQFLATTLELSKTDKDLRIDSILITSKMLIINDGSFHSQIVSKLSPNLQLYIEKLDNIIREESTEDILQMLTHLYRKRDYQHSQIFSERMYTFIWRALQELIKEMSQKYDIINNQIWDFLYQFCQIESPTIHQILNFLYKQCLSKEIGDYEQRAVKILAKNYRVYSEQAFYFWAEELIELHLYEELCKNLLQIIKECLNQAPNPLVLLDSAQGLTDLLYKLVFSEDSDISQLSSSIVHIGDQPPQPQIGMDEEIDDSKGSKKSFRTACEVLSTPLQIISPPICRNYPPTMQNER